MIRVCQCVLCSEKFTHLFVDYILFLFKQKTAYEMRISDWSSDVCSSDLPPPAFFWWWFSFDAYEPDIFQRGAYIAVSGGFVSIIVAIGMSVWRAREIGSASCRERVCQ